MNQPAWTMHRAFVTLVLLSTAAGCLWPIAAEAADPVAFVETDNHAEIGQPFAHVLKIAGDVAATAIDSSETRHLKQGDLVTVGDHLQSSPGGEALLRELDGGMLALRPSSELWVETFAAAGQPTDHAGLRLVLGGVRSITGWIGRLNSPGERIFTPTATIGIRGTDHESYVIGTEMGEASHEPLGSYDKVSTGATVLSAGNQDLVLKAGQVGFVGASRPATRGLMTLILPVLLDRVPTFYSGGTFDADMDAYALKAEAESGQMLKQQLGLMPSGPIAAACEPSRVAKLWLTHFDSAEVRRDSRSIIALFADDVEIKATVHNASGEATTVNVGRDEFVTNTVASMNAVKNFHQQRLNANFSASADQSSEGCPDVLIASGLVERGVMQGKPYRIESRESYTLEMRHGKWLAVSASTMQQ